MPEIGRKLRICYVLNTFELGGAETVALDLARSHTPDRFEVELLGAMDPASESEPPVLARCREFGVKAVSLEQPNLRSLRAILKFYNHLRRGRFDLVVGHNRGSDFWAVWLGLLAGIKHRYWVRHLVYLDMDARRLRRYRWSARFVHRVYAVSESVRNSCITVEGIAPERVRTVANGIDTTRFRPLDPDRRGRVRDGLGHESGKAMILFVGRFADQKAPHAFIDLVGALAERGVPAVGYMCGRGPLESELRDRAEVRQGTVRVLGLRADVPDLLGAADVFVSTSRNEGLPLNVMEAMSAGTAIMAPAIPQVAELAAGSALLVGALVPPPPAEGDVPCGQVQQWADCLEALVRDDASRADIGSAGRKMIRERFSLESMVGSYETDYLQDCGIPAVDPVVRPSGRGTGRRAGGE